MKFEHWLDRRKDNDLLEHFLQRLQTALEATPINAKLIRTYTNSVMQLLNQRGYEQEAKALQHSYESTFNNMGQLWHPDLSVKSYKDIVAGLIYHLFQKHPMFQPEEDKPAR